MDELDYVDTTVTVSQEDLPVFMGRFARIILTMDMVCDHARDTKVPLYGDEWNLTYFDSGVGIHIYKNGESEPRASIYSSENVATNLFAELVLTIGGRAFQIYYDISYGGTYRLFASNIRSQKPHEADEFFSELMEFIEDYGVSFE